MGSYTEGPWEIDRHGVSDSRYKQVCRRPIGKDKTIVGKQWPENARLIAAAPELLEALEVMTERYADLVNCGDCGHWNPEQEAEVMQARAAIAKAKGKTP